MLIISSKYMTMKIVKYLILPKRGIWLSVSKKNKTALDIVEDYSLVFNLNTAQTIFRIVREYDKMLKWNIYNKGLE